MSVQPGTRLRRQRGADWGGAAFGAAFVSSRTQVVRHPRRLHAKKLLCPQIRAGCLRQAVPRAVWKERIFPRTIEPGNGRDGNTWNMLGLWGAVAEWDVRRV